MNEEEFREWQGGVTEHISHLETLTTDRKLLKRLFEEHIKEYFDFDSSRDIIKYSRDFKTIKIIFFTDNNVVMPKKIDGLHMPWSIQADGGSVIVELYPFGLEKEGDVLLGER